MASEDAAITAPLNILVIEDQPADFILLERHLRRAGMVVRCRQVDSADTLDAALRAGPWDLVLADYHVPGMVFDETLARLRSEDPERPIILVSGALGDERAVDLLKAGVADFVIKDRLARLVPSIERELREGQERRSRQESEVSYYDLFQSIGDAICILGESGRIVAVNRCAEILYGRPRAFIVGQTLDYLVPSDKNDPLAIAAAVARARAGESSRTAIYAMRANGVPFPGDLSLHRTTFGTRPALIAVVRDKTRMLRTEHELAEAQRIAHVGHLRLGDGRDDLVWSDEVYRIFEEPRETFEPTWGRLLERVHPDDREPLERVFRGCLENPEVGECEIETRLLLPRGRVKYLQLRVEPRRGGADGPRRRTLGTVLDVTRQKETERSLRDSQLWVNRILDSVPDSILVVDGAGRVVRANHRVQGMLGYSPEELVGQLVEVLVPEAQRGDHARLLRSYQAKPSCREMGRSLELFARHRDGTLLPTEISLSPLSTGGVDHVIVTLRDIAERKASAALIEEDRAQQTTLRALLEISLGDHSLEQSLTLCLDRLLELAWLEPPRGAVFLMEEPQRRLRLVASRNMPPELTSRCAYVALGECLCGQAASSGVMQYAEHVDGRHEVNYPGMEDHGHYAVPLVSDEGRLGVLMLYLTLDFKRTLSRDQFIDSVGDILAGIISRKQNESARRSQEQMTLAILDSLPGNIAVLDPDGSILRVNRAWRECYVAFDATEPAGAAPGCNYFDAARAAMLAGDVDAAGAVDGIQEVIAGSQPNFYMEYPCHTPDEQRWYAMTVTPLHGAAHGAVVGHVDITGRKLTENELKGHQEHLEELVGRRTADLERARLQAERLAQVKDTFLATMSHEIRTPMNAMLGMIELMEISGLNPEQNRMANLARDGAKSLMRIIDDILDFSKIEAGRLEIRAEPNSLFEIVDKTVGFFDHIAGDKGLKLLHSVSEEISPAVMVDAQRLRQILNNLVSNAIKFTDRGRVELRVELVERHSDRDRVRISIADTGVGISPEAQTRLFEPFSQVLSDSASQQRGGTGLGLAICRRLAELMGGEIELRSAPGQGSTIVLTLELPVVDAQQLGQDRRVPETPAKPFVPREPPSLDQARAAGRLVLLVDDHGTNRELLTAQLRLLGYASQEATSGAEALRMWEEGRYGLLITDCHMPEMDGYQLAREVRRREAATGRDRLPILAWTANAMRDVGERCGAAGMDDVLIKPCALGTLADRLERLLGPSGAATTPRPAAPTSASDAVLEPSRLQELCGNDAELQKQMLTRFAMATRSDAADLVEAVAGRDATATTRLAHRMKGAGRMVGAGAFAQACESLEQAGRREDWHAIEALAHPELRDALAQLEHALASL